MSSSNPKGTPIPLQRFSAPAQRALTGAGYTTLEQIAAGSEAEIIKLHGVGKHTLKTLNAVLTEHGLTFASKT